MNIINTYNKVKKLFIDNNNFNYNQWSIYADSILPGLADLLERDSTDYNYERDILPTITNALVSKEKLYMLHQSFLTVTKHLQHRIVAVFGIDIDVDIILYLGLCNGAGWATNIHGRKSILLGIEKIVELDWFDENSMIALIYHELGHIWHESIRTTKENNITQGKKNMWQVYTEGVAMYCEQLLYDKPHYYHQDKNGWLIWCNSNKDIVISEYKKRIISNESVQEFFGDWNKFLDHSDVGYYIGTEFIYYLSKKYKLDEIATLNMDVITEEFLSFK
ncbi:MAG: hypothetical protein K0S41_2387 [Anaerocolumna sp.]|jgi:hypothetical protein|nr:hypothetical protein [Anaerocolumna sp.]